MTQKLQRMTNEVFVSKSKRCFGQQEIVRIQKEPNHLSKKWFGSKIWCVGILCSMTGDRRGEKNSPARHSNVWFEMNLKYITVGQKIVHK